MEERGTIRASRNVLTRIRGGRVGLVETLAIVHDVGNVEVFDV